MSLVLFKNVTYKLYIYKSYLCVFKQDLALDNLHKTQPTILIFVKYLLLFVDHVYLLFFCHFFGVPFKSASQC